jgi:DNA-binding GntR family transcriptional regulator
LQEIAREKVVGAPETIAERVREMVARGILHPGMRLGQTELARQFQTSRVPLREAFKLLTSEGMVEHDPNRGFFIARFSSDEAEQLFRMRHLIEDELLKGVIWPEKKHLDELAGMAAGLEKLLNAGDRVGWWSAHRAFHTALFDLSPDKIIMREAMRLWQLTDRYRAMLPMPKPGSEERRVVEKESFIDALRAKDLKGLLKVRRERRDAFEKLVMATLKERGL